MSTVQLLIKGKVQGVFYRATAKKEADSLGLKGWIKNTYYGEQTKKERGYSGQQAGPGRRDRQQDRKAE